MQIYRQHRRDPAQVALHRLMIAAVPQHPAIGSTLDRARINYVRPIDELIERAMASGMIRQMSVPELREAMFDLLVNGAASQTLFGMTPDMDDATFDFRWQLLLFMVAANTGPSGTHDGMHL